TVNIASLTTNAGGTTVLNAGTFTTTAGQTHNDDVTLGAAATLNAGAGNVSFNGAVSGAFSLAVNSTGTTTFGDLAGTDTVNIARERKSAGEGTRLNAGTCTTTAGQTHNDDVTLGAATTLNAGEGNVSFNGAVSGAVSRAE